MFCFDISIQENVGTEFNFTLKYFALYLVGGAL